MQIGGNSNVRLLTLQHTATRCNSLQHSATLCKTLHLTASHCNSLQLTATNTLHTVKFRRETASTATYVNTLQHTATHCNTLQHTTIYCRSVDSDVKLLLLTHENSERPFGKYPEQHELILKNILEYYDLDSHGRNLIEEQVCVCLLVS